MASPETVCLFRCSGCSAPLTLQQFPLHLVSCDKVDVVCPACQLWMRKSQLYSHNNTCEKRLIHCEKCSSRFYPQEQAEHDVKCAELALKCKFYEKELAEKRKFMEETKQETLKLLEEMFKEYFQESRNAVAEQVNKRQKLSLSTGSQVFEAEEILDMKMKNGVQYYHVKWKPVNGMIWQNTWEPCDKLAHCQDLLDEFEAGLAKTGERRS